MKKLTPNEILEEFQQLETIGDLAILLQKIYSKNIRTANKKKFEITESLLSYYAFVIDKNERYKTFQIPKKRQSYREISSPIFTLKIIQQCLNELLSSVYFPKAAVNGFVKGRSIVDNARRHTKKKYVYNLDVKDFFPSTKFGRILKVLEGRPFLLKEKRYRIGILISSLCCNEGSLPQGAPTSPILTNIICRRIDAKFMDLAKKNRAQYSRYADDITFSCNKNIFDDRFYSKIEQILKTDGYDINTKKVRLQDWRQRQVVTGLIVNKVVNVDRQFLKDIRYWLFLISKKGLGIAQIDFNKRFQEKKSYFKYNKKAIPVENYLEGKINFLKMVKGENNPIYLKYKSEFNLASKRKSANQNIGKLGQKVMQEKYNNPTLSLIRNNSPSINYDFVTNLETRAFLYEDNKKMEDIISASNVIGDNGQVITIRESFIKYCFYASFQAERLINHFYHKTYESNVEMFKSYAREKQRAYNRKNNFPFIGGGPKYTFDQNSINRISFNTKILLFLIWEDRGLEALYEDLYIIKEIRNRFFAHPSPSFNYTGYRQYKERINSLLNDSSDFLLIRNILEKFVIEIKEKY